jgi:preprotein translocase subunit SecE
MPEGAPTGAPGSRSTFLFSTAGECMNLIQYFRDSRGELSRVSWPTRQQVFEGTQAVLIFVVALTLIVWMLDVLFSTVIRLVLP